MTGTEEDFWDLADARIGAGRAERGTIMSSACLRRKGEFVAMYSRTTGAMVVKLDRDQVAELIRSGAGDEFAPAGKVFREWVAVGPEHVERWEGLLDDGLDRADARARR